MGTVSKIISVFMVNYRVFPPHPARRTSARPTLRPKLAGRVSKRFNPLYVELNPICHLLALLGVHHFLHVSRIRVKSLTLRLLMSYIHIYIYIYVCVCVWSAYS